MHNNRIISDAVSAKLKAAAAGLIDQERAEVIVEPYEDGEGFWFGGGNLIEGADGNLYLCGRYRNKGDSRTGLEMGARGLELAVFRREDGGRSFEKLLSFQKEELATKGTGVLSIEGSALSLRSDGKVELYVSTEKSGVPYPGEIAKFQKPGTGVWSIDLLTAESIEGLQSAEVKPLLSGDTPEHLHVKDPVIHHTEGGDTVLIFCHHPYSWASSNSAYCIRRRGESAFSAPDYRFFPRGTAWDVAVSRITDVLTLSEEIVDSNASLQMVFYDGAECMRPHEQNRKGVRRPRGYSCEEIAGLAAYTGEAIGEIERISKNTSLFTSPWGTNSCRYIHTCATKGGVYATWQRSGPSEAQALVLNFLSWEEIRYILHH